MEGETRTGLTRQMIIERALGLLDEVGLDGLTVRRIAAELGVKSPALYWHFRNKQELLDGMAEVVLIGGGVTGPQQGERWQEWLANRARERRRALLAYRDGARLVVNARLGPASTRLFDATLAALVAHGFTPVLAVRTIMTLSHFVDGVVLQAQAQRHEADDTPGAALAALAGVLDGGMAAPLVVALRDGGDPLGEDAFEHGLRVMIDGTAAALERHREDGR